MLIPAALAAITAVASCSSSSDPGSSASGASGKAALQTVRIEVASNASFDGWPVYIADVKGYFADNGVKIELIHGAPGASQVAALTGGATDLANIDLSNTGPLLNAGKKLTDVAQIDVISEVLVAGKGAPVKSFSDLMPMPAGTTVAAPSAGGEVANIVKDMQTQYGGDTGNIKVVADAPGVGLLSGAESYWFGDQEPACVLQSQGATELLDTGNPAGGFAAYPKLSGFLGLPDNGLWSSGAWSSAHPDLVKDVQKAINEAETYIKSNPAQAATALRGTAENVPTLSASQFETCVKKSAPAFNDSFSASDVSRYETWLTHLKVIDKPLPPSSEWLAPGIAS